MVGGAIETKRLRLRSFTPDDLDALTVINSDPVAMRHIGDGKPITREETQKRIHRYLEHWREHGFGLWAVDLKAEAAFIGFCGLQMIPKTNEIEVGFRFSPRYWGRGLATEATAATLEYGFERLEIDRIIGLAHPENVASQRVLEKIGLRYIKEAEYYDTIVRYYVLTQKEYRTKKGLASY